MSSPLPPPEISPLSPLSTTIHGLTFDIFGTTVSWRVPLTALLTTAAAATLSRLPPSSPFHPLLSSLTEADWARFAAEWHAAYTAFTRAFVPGRDAWVDVDTHNRESLGRLLKEWGLEGVYGPEEVDRLARGWHELPPWGDTVPGLERLGKRFVTASLSNGNRGLLKDLDGFAGGLGFWRLLGAEDFGAYKPRPEVYLGACREVGAEGEPGKVAMVAAHLEDLAAARRVGMRTVYVERPEEEAWGVEEERYQEARGWVDVWVGERGGGVKGGGGGGFVGGPGGEGGFEELARRLGV
ncbi:haloacid dehalogenase [Staphylotrichum tortipilum]|uniref:Haloacid dehalogenase n=1 Tax=Staphylotrichum tortipilum TaxID=2831512 RepID=A0AAN6RS53_9PEZI|nr:haloacid dehalogenase [Staphylotrichum longicolle]